MWHTGTAILPAIVSCQNCYVTILRLFCTNQNRRSLRSEVQTAWRSYMDLLAMKAITLITISCMGIRNKGKNKSFYI